MGSLSPTHMVIVLVAFMVLFGAKKLPDAARSIGRSAKIFKAETQGLLTDEEQPALDQPTHAEPQVRARTRDTHAP